MFENGIRYWMKYQVSRILPIPHNKGIILLYHRVADLDIDTQLLAVSPKNFNEHMKYISENYNPITLKEMVEYAQTDEIPDRSISITFDDGYADNLINGKSILDKYNVPATVFVTGGMVDENKEIWWDELENIIFKSDQLPDQITIEEYHKPLYFNNMHAKIDSFNILRSCILSCSSGNDMKNILDELHTKTGVLENTRIANVILNSKQLIELESSNLIAVGAHTINHPQLSALDYQSQVNEIYPSKELLENVLGHRVSTFSYPFGTHQHFTNETKEIVEKSEFDIACANFEGVITKGIDKYALPRFIARNWEVNKFANHLKMWFNKR